MKFKLSYIVIGFVVVIGFMLFNSYNTIQSNDERVSASWSEVVNQYQRRADLISNLVNTVKGYTQHEKELLIQVTEARAKVTSIQINAEKLTDAKLMQQFQQAQQQLSSALSRLIAVSENYPDLKADKLYHNLMVQLEGTENRITVAKKRYIDAIQTYNSHIRSLPAKFIANYYDLQPKAQFSVPNEPELSTVPTVKFD